MNDVAAWLHEHMLACPSVKWMHIQCPGCGMQRSAVALLNGELQTSLSLHPATLPFLALMLLAPLHLLFRFRHGGKALIALQMIVAGVSLAFYVYKIIHHQIIV